MVGRIKPVRAMLTALLIPALLAAWAQGAAAGATLRPAPVVAPADLQALEQRMLALQLTSERVTASLSVSETPKPTGLGGGFGHVFGKSSALTTGLLTMSGEVSFAPQAANIQMSFFGLHMNARLLGSTLYIEEPELARLDGGRPWVVMPNQHIGSAVGVGPSADAEGGLEPAASFKSVVETIAHAQSIEEVGPVTVNGRATTEFKLAIPFERLGKLRRSQARLLHRLFAPVANVELFIAEDGLPVRTRIAFRVRPKKGQLIVQSDVLATDIPVLVEAPPAAETIGEAQLRQLLRKRLISAERRGKNHGKHRHPARKSK
jgi:hypothetical protein